MRDEQSPETAEDAALLEDREVSVHEPGLSDRANLALTEDVRDVIGADHVHVPADRSHASLGEGEDNRRGPLHALLGTNRFILWQIAAALIVVGCIIALTTDDWWLLPLAVIVLGLGTFTVVRMVLGMTAAEEQPSANTAAILEEEGVADPDRLFSDIVSEFTENTGALGDERRTVAVEDDPVAAAAEQQDSITATGGVSRPVGPGSHS